MANSPSHKLGQIIGDLLEEIIEIKLCEFCKSRNLYLDKKELRPGVRTGRKVSWVDKFGNSHDLDFVIEKNGTKDKQGKPLAFIEVAWRRYTKHSKNKVQEIQSAVLPIAEKLHWDNPFLGTVLAGEFTNNSLIQMRSTGFRFMHIPYDSIKKSFESVGISLEFDESTPHKYFNDTVEMIESLSEADRKVLKKNLISNNLSDFQNFLTELEKFLDRKVDKIILIPLYGKENIFNSVTDVINFLDSCNTQETIIGSFRRFEVIVTYNNGSKIDAQFTEQEELRTFLQYVSS